MRKGSFFNKYERKNSTLAQVNTGIDIIGHLSNWNKGANVDSQISKNLQWVFGIPIVPDKMKFIPFACFLF